MPNYLIVDSIFFTIIFIRNLLSACVVAPHGRKTLTKKQKTTKLNQILAIIKLCLIKNKKLWLLSMK